MAITLAHVAKLETSPLKKGIMMNILREVKLFELIPWENISSLRVAGVRWRNLPNVAFRGINEAYTASEGDVEQVWESLYGFGGEIQYDRVFDKITGSLIVDPKTLQTEMKVMAMALKFNDYFINGDPTVDVKGFSGLKYRVSLMPTRQSVYFAASNAAALDPVASVANGNTFFTKLEEMKYKTAGGQVGAWLMNEGMRYGLGRVARYIQASGGNWLSTAKDSFDREIPTLWGAPIVDTGLKADQATEIITDTEVAGDSGADATSIYAVSFDGMNGLTGAQLSPMDVYDPLSGGERSDTPAKMIRIDWWLGLVSMGSYGITRGRNVEGAANW